MAEDLPDLVRRALGLMCGKCGLKPAEGGSCPYAHEIHGDDKECDCCEDVDMNAQWIYEKETKENSCNPAMSIL